MSPHGTLLALLALFACGPAEPPAPPPEPPGSNPGDPNAGPPVDPDKFIPPGTRDTKAAVHAGPTTTVTGTITLWQPDPNRGEKPISYAGTLRVELVSDEEYGSGRAEMLASHQLPTAGPFELTVPQDLGRVHLFAYLDADGDGPGEDEPRGNSASFTVGERPITGVELEIGPSRRPEHDE